MAKASKAAKKAAVKPRTKSQILQELAEATELSKKDVAQVFEVMNEMIHKDLQKKGPGAFTIPGGLVKIRAVDKPPKPKRMGRNPQTGEEIEIPAKPARREVKVRALKTLKEYIDTKK